LGLADVALVVIEAKIFFEDYFKNEVVNFIFEAQAFGIDHFIFLFDISKL